MNETMYSYCRSFCSRPHFVTCINNEVIVVITVNNINKEIKLKLNRTVLQEVYLVRYLMKHNKNFFFNSGQFRRSLQTFISRPKTGYQASKPKAVLQVTLNQAKAHITNSAGQKKIVLEFFIGIMDCRYIQVVRTSFRMESLRRVLLISDCQMRFQSQWRNSIKACQEVQKMLKVGLGICNKERKQDTF